MYVNVGAFINGQRAKTKRELKNAMLMAPETVLFDQTALLMEGQFVHGNAIPPGVTLSVVGPNPYNNRKWYASVSDKGKVT